MEATRTPVARTVTPKSATGKVSTGDSNNRSLGLGPDLIEPITQASAHGISISQPGLGTAGLEHLTACPGPSVATWGKSRSLSQKWTLTLPSGLHW